ncbi:BREX-1 system adenine-specific DNA-methyltransferase PglX [Alcaligenes aquatilis]|uniref:BREX-1 system adenine-specific DNA-methyltransferase PglX n=1 Tax=Alcaligenes aquatilis TaxID=323284 RepID=A0A3G2HQM9_9BURK|nr:BREX-1 system adenine-specific DNA-methyltransferase PglX [Alcaligenes aquatilis]AYN19430.1 BREX-1 system adenine-specific DNA-methyltransferase PglX [Alcaligenes aquatilis]
MSEIKNDSSEQRMKKYFYRVSAKDFEALPGSPLAYWAPSALFSIFSNNRSFNDVLEAREGLTTGSNQKHVRFHFEISRNNIGRGLKSRIEAKKSAKKWFPYNKGGEFRKWYGNDLFVVNWLDDGKELQETLHPSGERIWAHNFNLDYIFKPSVSWSDITTKGLSARLFPAGFLFDATGLSAFERNTIQESRFKVAAICNSKVGSYISPMLNPTMHFKSGDFSEMPLASGAEKVDQSNILSAYNLSVADWDSYEISWDFASLPLLHPDHHQPTLTTTYQNLRFHWRSMTQEMQRLEEENNRIFIEAYGLQDELTPEVPLREITLTCNPHYRYGGDKTEEELEALLLADTMREFISYAVGCMFGRYSLDKPGLILANQGDTLADYLAQVPEPTFMPDKDNVIPMLDGDWFANDIAERFRRFLRVTFGEEHYEENLRFIEESLNVKGKRSYSLRDYFLSEFYTDHLKRYKKRPIYWLFSSPKGSFNALIYMHRYRPDTVSVVLNDYLREFRAKLLARKNHLEALGISASASQAEKTKALKEVEKISKMIAEVDAYERDTLYPLATQQLEIDLDDGVKANYPKFGAALKKIPGLEAKDD